MDNKKLLPIPELLKKSFDFYRPRIWTMFLLSLIGLLGTIIVLVVFGVVGFIAFVIGRVEPIFNLSTVLLFLIGILLIIVWNLWIQIALFYVIKEENIGRNIRESLLLVRDKMGSYYWVIFLNSIVVLLGLMLFIIPGIIFAIKLCLSRYTLVFEDLKGAKALSRSKELTRGYFWPVLGRVSLFLMLIMIISSIDHSGYLINAFFTMPFGIIYTYVIYEDLKRVKA